MQKKIIVVETDRVRKDCLKTLLSTEGYVVFSFDNMAVCIENMDQLDADLIVFCQAQKIKAIEHVNALVAVKYRLPLLIISNNPGPDSCLKEF